MPLDLSQLARRLTSLAKARLFPALSSSYELLPSLLGDQNQLQQIILNLCVNARDAMPSGGTISRRTSIVAGRLLAALGASRGQELQPACPGRRPTGTPA